MVTYGSVCSGIESASVAWAELGLKPAWVAEVAPFPSAVLAYRFPEVPNLGDLRGVGRLVLSGKIEAPDVLISGTPCQAFTLAGMREGLADERGALAIKFVELADAIDHVRGLAGKPPGIVVWENVPGVLSDKANAFGCLLAALVGESCELLPTGRKWTDAGVVYGPARAVAWRILNAQHFGVAQRRRRLFVVASARKGFDPGAVLFDLGSVRRDSSPLEPKGSNAEVRQCRCGYGFSVGTGILQCPKCRRIVAIEAPAWWNGFGVSQTLDAVLDKHQALPEKNRFPAVLDNGRLRFITPREAERLQGLPDDFTRIPWRGKPAEQCPDGHRYKAIGNTKAVPVVRWLGRRLLAVINQEGVNDGT